MSPTSPARISLTADLARALVAATATWAALTTWAPFLVDTRSFLAPAALIGLSVVATGVILRALRLPWFAVPLAQAVVVACVLSAEVVGSWIPVGSSTGSFTSALEAAAESARTYAAPVAADAPPITPLLLLGAAALFWLVDLLACTLRLVSVAGLPLLAAFSVPAGLTGSAPHWVAFTVAAVGYLALLHLDATSRLSRWGRRQDGGDTPRTSTPDGGAVTATVSAGRNGALSIGAIAIGLALLAPSVVPVLDAEIIGFGGDGGSGEIKIRKPRADLRRDLERGQDIPLLQVTTDDPQPSYLRIGVLNRFTGNEWSSGDRDVSSDQTANRELPDPQGLSPDVPVTTYEYQVEIGEAFDSTWLPTQFPISSISSTGDWRYDEDTFDFLAVDDQNAAGTSYRMTAVEPEFGTSGRWFANPSASAVDPEVLEVPGGLPSLARNLALEVTDGALDDYERARMLQAWFRTEGGFRYDLEAAPNGSVGQTLETFLAEGPDGRVGYCEQFAAAMAIMARVVGIPARVAVGFLRPTEVGESTWEYSSHDLHAWPELYFAGAGWVRFEPTPGGRARTAPDYSTVPVRSGPEDDPGNAPGQQPSQSEGPVQQPSDSAAPEEPEESGAAEGADEGSTADLVSRLLLAAAATVLLLAVLAGPRMVRRRQRARRMHGTPEELWREVLATARDLSIDLPAGRSPRETALRIEKRMATRPAPDDLDSRPRTGAAATPEAVAALVSVVREVERHRYARPPVPSAPGGTVALLERPRQEGSTTLRDATATVIDALEDGTTRSRRRRATWWPRSVWRR